MESEMIMVVAIVAIACCTGLIKSWMNNRYNDNTGINEEDFDRLANAFMQHRKDMRERVENLEAIIAEENPNESFEQIEAPETDGDLTNDLQNKNKVSS